MGMIIDDLKAYMTQKNMTQEALAGKIGVSWSTVQRWLKGKSEPSALAMDKIGYLLKKK